MWTCEHTNGANTTRTLYVGHSLRLGLVIATARVVVKPGMLAEHKAVQVFSGCVRTPACSTICRQDYAHMPTSPHMGS